MDNAEFRLRQVVNIVLVVLFFTIVHKNSIIVSENMVLDTKIYWNLTLH